MTAREEKTAVVEQQAITGFDWYVTTELASYVVNSLIVRYGSLLLQEQEKPRPNTHVIRDYRTRSNELQSLLHHPDTFKTMERMEAVINEYSPLLKEMDERA